MSEHAINALINIGTLRQGVTAVANKEALTELQALGYIGPKLGLTSKGAGRRARLMMEIEKEQGW